MRWHTEIPDPSSLIRRRTYNSDGTFILISTSEAAMAITGARVLLYTTGPEAQRAVFRDVFELRACRRG
jgi:hypothetical protein